MLGCMLVSGHNQATNLKISVLKAVLLQQSCVENKKKTVNFTKILLWHVHTTWCHNPRVFFAHPLRTGSCNSPGNQKHPAEYSLATSVRPTAIIMCWFVKTAKQNIWFQGKPHTQLSITCQLSQNSVLRSTSPRCSVDRPLHRTCHALQGTSPPPWHLVSPLSGSIQHGVR